MTRSAALIVDHPARDLSGLVLTAFALCQHDVKCHLVPVNAKEPEIWALAPDFVLLNFIRHGREGTARRLVQAGIPFGVLDTEGAVWSDRLPYQRLLWKDRSLLSHIRTACVWGPATRDFFTFTGLLAEEQIAVTGCPRFDFYSPLWSSSWNGNRPKRCKIIIATSFATANPRFVSVEQNIRQLVHDYGLESNLVADYVEHERQAVDAAVELARALATDFPTTPILIRPHPFEDPRTYARQLAGIPGIEVSNDAPVESVLPHGAVLIQRNSTIAIEAATFAGLPTLSPLWFPAADVKSLTDVVSVGCHSYQELRDSIQAILDDSFRIPDPIRAARHCLEQAIRPVDGLAHQRVAEAVLRAFPATSSTDLRECRRRMYGLGRRSPSISDRIARRLRYAMELPTTWSFRRRRTLPLYLHPAKRFDTSGVQAVLSRITDALESRGVQFRPVTAQPASQCGSYIGAHDGPSITLTADG